MKQMFYLIFTFIFSFNTYAIANVGLELDLFPFATGGNYIGLGIAENGNKFRVIRAESNMPDFILQDGIEKVEMEVYAFIVDYYFDNPEEYTGFWTGVGVESWSSKISEEDGEQDVSLHQKIFTVGAGYVFKLTENLTINPWGAVHVDLSSENEIIVGETEYEIQKVIPEISLKIGWIF